MSDSGLELLVFGDREDGGNGENVKNGVNPFQCGHVPVSRMVERTSLGVVCGMNVFARTVKDPLIWVVGG